MRRAHNTPVATTKVKMPLIPANITVLGHKVKDTDPAWTGLDWTRVLSHDGRKIRLPLGYSCPWYALIEDRGPHFVGSPAFGDGTGYAVWFDSDRPNCKPEWMDGVVICQHSYRIVEERIPKREWVVKDARYETPYRFKFWLDPDVDLVAAKHIGTIKPDYRPKGGWFIQNMDFV